MERKYTFQKGQAPWNKGKKYWQVSGDRSPTKRLEVKNKIAEGIKKHYDIVGRKSKVNELLRKSMDYINWRKAVFARDNYKCQRCGNNHDLHPHHKKEFAKYPELRFDIENGETLCESCHGKIHGIDYKKHKRDLCCKYCKNKFKVKDGQYKHQFCSKECWYKYKSTIPSSKKGKKYPHLLRKPIKKCVVCKKEFRSTWHKNRKQIYCSRGCWNMRKLIRCEPLYIL